MRVAEFLGRSFEQEEGRRAAAKNAFTLLGQHRRARVYMIFSVDLQFSVIEPQQHLSSTKPCLRRYLTAAGFFLLAGCTWDAVSVLARECGDPQLALLTAALVEGRPQRGGAALRLVHQVRRAVPFLPLPSVLWGLVGRGVGGGGWDGGEVHAAAPAGGHSWSRAKGRLAHLHGSRPGSRGAGGGVAGAR